jgi:hypothetical protein
LYKFIGGKPDLSKFPSEARGFGIKPEKLPDFLSSFLKPHDTVPSGNLAYYHFLDNHGPALVVLNEPKDNLHAQVLTGIYIGPYKSTVFMNNPDQDFAKADLSASGPFLQIERSIMNRYGGTSFEEWEETWPKDEDEDDAAQTVPAHGSPNTSPAVSRQSSLQPSPRRSPPASPQHSPVVSRRGSTSNVNSPPPEPTSARLAGPTLSSIDWSALKMQLERELPGSASSKKHRKYLEAMEEQCLFRQHRPMELSVFQTKLMKEKGVASLWTLRDW